MSLLYSLDKFSSENVIIFFFGIQISKWRSFEKGLLLTYFSYYFSHQGKKKQKFFQHISHLYTYTYFAHPIDFFCLTNFPKITNLSCMISLWCDSWCWFLFAPFRSNQQMTKLWAKFRLECLILIFIDTNAKFIVICNPRTLNDSTCRRKLSSIQKTQKALLLSSSHFVFYQ